MALVDELRAFIGALSSTAKEAKANKEALNMILKKYQNKAGHCSYCGQPFNAEIKGLLFAREKIIEPYDVPADFKIDMRLKELGWDVDER